MAAARKPLVMEPSARPAATAEHTEHGARVGLVGDGVDRGYQVEFLLVREQCRVALFEPHVGQAFLAGLSPPGFQCPGRDIDACKP